MTIENAFHNKYSLVKGAARRARQLQSGASPLIVAKSMKACRVAQDEIKQGHVKSFCRSVLLWIRCSILPCTNRDTIEPWQVRQSSSCGLTLSIFATWASMTFIVRESRCMPRSLLFPLLLPPRFL